MRCFRLIGLALASCLASNVAALAQQSSSRMNWTGFYVGANAGYTWSRSSSTAASDCPATGYYCSNAGLLPNAVTVAQAGTGSLDSSGFSGGVQAGYNWQGGQFVLGTEADFGAFRLRATHSASGTFPVAGLGTSSFVTAGVEADWLMTARLRAGWTVSNALFFVTGGLAISDVRSSLSYRDNTSTVVGTDGTGSASASGLRAGYTLGGGVELALSRNWSLKGEYLFVDLGKERLAASVTNPFFVGRANLLSTEIDLTAQIARLGFNYRF